MLLRALCMLVALSVGAAAHAQTRYVDDELVITLRTGPSTQNEIIRTLSSGARVEILETRDDEYARVRVASDDAEGWVLQQYLTDERIAADRLAQAERELAAAQSRVTELEERVAELMGELETTRSDLEAARAENERLGSELADVRSASENALSIREENERLQQRVSSLNERLQRATMANAELRSRSRQSWFIVGAGVLLGGIVIGLVAPSLRRRRRTNW